MVAEAMTATTTARTTAESIFRIDTLLEHITHSETAQRATLAQDYQTIIFSAGALRVKRNPRFEPPRNGFARCREKG
jgi:hypothetical protein